LRNIHNRSTLFNYRYFQRNVLFGTNVAEIAPLNEDRSRKNIIEFYKEGGGTLRDFWTFTLKTKGDES
jgi:hypothetical protein